MDEKSPSYPVPTEAEVKQAFISCSNKLKNDENFNWKHCDCCEHTVFKRRFHPYYNDQKGGIPLPLERKALQTIIVNANCLPLIETSLTFEGKNAAQHKKRIKELAAETVRDKVFPITNPSIQELPVELEPCNNSTDVIANVAINADLIDAEAVEAKLNLADLDSSTEQLLILENQIQLVREFSRNQQVHFAATEDQLVDTRNQLVTMEDQLVDTRNQLVTMEDQLVDTRNQLTEMKTQLVTTRNRLVATEGQLTEMKVADQEQQERIRTLENQFKASFLHVQLRKLINIGRELAENHSNLFTTEQKQFLSQHDLVRQGNASAHEFKGESELNRLIEYLEQDVTAIANGETIIQIAHILLVNKKLKTDKKMRYEGK